MCVIVVVVNVHRAGYWCAFMSTHNTDHWVANKFYSCSLNPKLSLQEPSHNVQPDGSHSRGTATTATRTCWTGRTQPLTAQARIRFWSTSSRKRRTTSFWPIKWLTTWTFGLDIWPPLTLPRRQTSSGTGLVRRVRSLIGARMVNRTTTGPTTIAQPCTSTTPRRMSAAGLTKGALTYASPSANKVRSGVFNDLLLLRNVQQKKHGCVVLCRSASYSCSISVKRWRQLQRDEPFTLGASSASSSAISREKRLSHSYRLWLFIIPIEFFQIDQSVKQRTLLTYQRLIRMVPCQWRSDRKTRNDCGWLPTRISANCLSNRKKKRRQVHSQVVATLVKLAMS